jgi:flagellar basal body rod protein FlgG
MIRGFYASLSGLLTAVRRSEIIADNIANVNTTGFKASRASAAGTGFDVIRSVDGAAVGAMPTGAYAAGPYITFDQGPLELTGRPTDLAIEGAGFFAVARDGVVSYTRAGAFSIGADGRIVAPDGALLIDEAGQPITVAGGTIGFEADGTVTGTTQRIAIVAPAPGAEITRLGGTRFAFAPDPGRAAGAIRGGFLEMSSTDLAREFTELMADQASYGLNARALSLQDETLADLRSIGRLRG